MTYPPCLRGISLGLMLAANAPAAVAGHKDAIGLTVLLAELGAGAPTGAGVTVSQVEGPVETNYAASASEPELAGKTFTLKSGASDASYHANLVARSYCGSDNGIAPGISQVDAYEVNGWLNANFLHMGSTSPAIESRRIQNHSWAAAYGNQSSNEEAVRRFDFAIERDGFVAVVGLFNFTTNPVPALMAHAYNAIAVGIDSGNHSTGGTTFDVAGRIKPEIVAPSAFYAVSYSCGTVSGAAAFLLETADASPGLVNAREQSEVIKALLLAGAIKSPYPTWTRTPTQPLDLIYGAGLLNIQNSYHLLVAGEQAPSGSTTVSNRGWDFVPSFGTMNRYFFDVPAGQTLTNFSVILTWNRKVTDSNPGSGFTPTGSVADMNLRLYSASGFTLGTLLDSSVSTIQNVEHVFTSLGPGRYALEVTSDKTGFDYALAWGGTLQAQISTSTNNPVPVTISSNMTVTALFAERFTTNHPTPYWWLAQYGYTSNQETVVTNLGANGYPLWQSYVAGLVPTNPASQLRFTSQTLLNGLGMVLTWDTVTGRVYTVWNSTNANGNYTPAPGGVNLPATIPSFTNPIPPGAPQQFFLLEVQQP
ncbi:MAG: S8 family peptidase [Verrucomicrobia bacterium]|nr:S8 family peptidase [Verrucomicrobiota bacterium]